MIEHSIFYYPYASFKGEQKPLLKAAALYFDKLYILDPVKACWAGIGQNPLSDDLNLLEKEKILERIAPENVLHKYEDIIAESIRADLKDPEFLKLCEQSGRARRWTLAIAKVPKEIRADPEFNPLDRSMQHIMGDVARELSPGLGRYIEGYAEVYDEYRETDRGLTEYRYADHPLPLGEAIMINHALIGGLPHTGATPITDDPFHNKVLALKIQRAQRIPEVREILDEKAMQSELKTNRIAMTALTDLELGILPPEITMADILEYREENEGELKETRKKLSLLARKIIEKPWTEEFSDKLEHETIPDVQENLSRARETQDKWLKNRRVRLDVKAIGLVSAAPPLESRWRLAQRLFCKSPWRWVHLACLEMLPALLWSLPLIGKKVSRRLWGMDYNIY